MSAYDATMKVLSTLFPADINIVCVIPGEVNDKINYKSQETPV